MFQGEPPAGDILRIAFKDHTGKKIEHKFLQNSSIKVVAHFHHSQCFIDLVSMYLNDQTVV